MAPHFYVPFPVSTWHPPGRHLALAPEGAHDEELRWLDYSAPHHFFPFHHHLLPLPPHTPTLPPTSHTKMFGHPGHLLAFDQGGMNADMARHLLQHPYHGAHNQHMSMDIR